MVYASFIVGNTYIGISGLMHGLTYKCIFVGRTKAVLVETLSKKESFINLESIKYYRQFGVDPAPKWFNVYTNREVTGPYTSKEACEKADENLRYDYPDIVRESCVKVTNRLTLPEFFRN